MRRCSGVSTMKRPPSDQNAWAAQETARFLINDDHPLATVAKLGSGGQTGKARSHDNRVCLIHRSLP